MQPIVRLNIKRCARAEDKRHFLGRASCLVPGSHTRCAWPRALSRHSPHASLRQGISWNRGLINPSAPILFSGNPSLSPEQSRTIHAGAEQKLASDRVRLTAGLASTTAFTTSSAFRKTRLRLRAWPLTVLLPAASSTPTWPRARGAKILQAKRASHTGSAQAPITRTIPRARSPAPKYFRPDYIPGRPLAAPAVNSGNIVLNGGRSGG